MAQISSAAVHIPRSYDPALPGYDVPLCGASRYAQDGCVMIGSHADIEQVTCSNCRRIQAARDKKKEAD
jgi:hypothetical protein